jgi:hypothetical protein
VKRKVTVPEGRSRRIAASSAERIRRQVHGGSGPAKAYSTVLGVTYGGHLLPDDLPDAGFLDSLTGGNKGATEPTETSRDDEALTEPLTRMNPDIPKRAEAGSFDTRFTARDASP